MDATGKGSVGWLPQGIIASGIGYPGSAITFADLNGDKRVEYLAVNYAGNVEAYLNANAVIDDGPNAGHRNWIPQGLIFSSAPGARNNTQFADMNGDGRADYLEVTMSGSGGVLEWKNNGGIYSPRIPLPSMSLRVLCGIADRLKCRRRQWHSCSSDLVESNRFTHRRRWLLGRQCHVRLS